MGQILLIILFLIQYLLKKKIRERVKNDLSKCEVVE